MRLVAAAKKVAFSNDQTKVLISHGQLIFSTSRVLFVKISPAQGFKPVSSTPASTTQQKLLKT